MNKVVIGIIALSAIILIGGIFLFSSGEQATQETIAKVQATTAITETDQVKGTQNAAAILIEYSDFQCPACTRYHSFVNQAMEEFGSEIQVVFRHFPLTQIHPNAELAARAAEAAGKQGKFWEMHDLLFDLRDEWSNEANPQDFFLEYAQSLNLDIEEFKTDLDSPEVKDKVTQDYQSGLQLGVNATPTFFLNGTKLQNPRTYEEFKTLLQSATAENQP
jgi:protein-disulfide isomerase